MKSYCEHCDAERNTFVEQREETLPVKGEDTTVIADVRVCAVCNNPVWDRELDGESLKTAFDAYREKHGLLTCAQIKSFRDQYGLTQIQFARLLGLGDKTIARYETGSIQDEAINTLMVLASIPSNMRILRERKPPNFQEAQGTACQSIVVNLTV